jgi:hypothetical protein
MSARRQGSWQQYTTAVEELHRPDEGEGSDSDPSDDLIERGLSLQNLLRLNLQRLGHAEFRAGARPDDWRVTPPVLAVSATADGATGIVAGARSKRSLEQLANASREVATSVTPQELGPDAIVLKGDAHSLFGVASSAGLIFQPEPANYILTSLPVVDDRRLWRRAEAPVGSDWRIERFSVAELRWKASDRGEFDSCSLGLFRFALAFRLQVLLRATGGVFEVPGQVGKYLVLRGHRRRTVRYDASSKVFSTPAICRPPFLVERALLSCSGLLPLHERNAPGGGTLRYHGIPQEVASLTAAVLKQVLQ